MMNVFVKSRKPRRLFLCALGILLALAVPASAQDFTDYSKPYLTKRFPISLIYPAGSSRRQQLMNLKGVAYATIAYLQDKNNVYPDMRNAVTTQKALLPFRPKAVTFFDPITKRPYLPNPYLSHKPITAVSDPNTMVLFYESNPASDKTRGVAFADGHAAAVLESEWPRLKHLSRIP